MIIKRKTLNSSFLLLLFFITTSNAQSDIDKLLKGGELLLSGLTVFKVAKSDSKPESKTIESVCVKNKLVDKITFKISGTDENGDQVKKELVIQKDGKECLFLIPKGIYTYEILLINKDIYKKGEYKFEDEIIITIKDE
ncbi:hypothetical protein [Flavobacterium sp. 25HG05S-40]|uniref:hypothetical protein n=1 Tax=Flavobacterium sp. 25HG05S-40 TaxID=3458682 RepID=UPI00404427F5